MPKFLVQWKIEVKQYKFKNPTELKFWLLIFKGVKHLYEIVYAFKN